MELTETYQSESTDFRGFISQNAKKEIAAANYLNTIDTLEKREQFAVTLRSKKKMAKIQWIREQRMKMGNERLYEQEIQNQMTFNGSFLSEASLEQFKSELDKAVNWFQHFLKGNRKNFVEFYDLVHQSSFDLETLDQQYIDLIE